MENNDENSEIAAFWNLDLALDLNLVGDLNFLFAHLKEQRLLKIFWEFGWNLTVEKSTKKLWNLSDSKNKISAFEIFFLKIESVNFLYFFICDQAYIKECMWIFS